MPKVYKKHLSSINESNFLKPIICGACQKNAHFFRGKKSYFSSFYRNLTLRAEFFEHFRTHISKERLNIMSFWILYLFAKKYL